MWAESVPAIAFSSSVVSHALMAFSAFCLSATHCTSKGESRDLRATAERHYYQSVKLLRLSLAAVEQSDADVVLACAMVLIPCGLALAQGGHGGSSLYDWVYHLRGWRTIGSSIYGSQPDKSSQLIPYPQPGIPESGDLPEKRHRGNGGLRISSTNLFLEEIQRSWPEAVANLKGAVESRCAQTDDTSSAMAYRSAIAALENVVDYITSYPVANLFRAVFIWPIRVSSEFIRLAVDHDAIALAIYAHWLVLTMIVEELWWLQGFGSGKIERLVGRMARFGWFGSELMAWPVEMLGEWRRMQGEKKNLQGFTGQS